MSKSLLNFNSSLLINEHTVTFDNLQCNGKGKVIPLQAQCGPEGG